MKFKTFLISALMVLAATATTTRVYKPNEAVPRYIIKQRSDGTAAVYDSRQIVVPKFIIRGDRVYPAGKPCLPVYKYKEGGVNSK